MRGIRKFGQKRRTMGLLSRSASAEQAHAGNRNPLPYHCADRQALHWQTSVLCVIGGTDGDHHLDNFVVVLGYSVWLPRPSRWAEIANTLRSQYQVHMSVSTVSSRNSYWVAFRYCSSDLLCMQKQRKCGCTAG